MPRKLIPLLSILLVALFALGLVACGGGGDEDEDPQSVLDETFESGKDYSSGVLDIDFKLGTEGSQEGTLDATISGPFQSTEGGFPQFDLAADVNFEGGGQSFGFTGGLISTGEKAFVNFQDTDYEVDASTFDVFKQRFLSEQQKNEEGGTTLINPADFLTNLTNEGTEDVEGTETIHISGDADVNKLIESVQGTPGAESLPGAGQIDQLRDSISNATFEVFTGADDKRLRKLETTVSFKPPSGAVGAGDTYDLGFTLTFKDLGSAQTVQAPSNARPLNELLNRYRDDLGGLLGGLGAGAGAGGPGGGTGTPAPGAPTPPSSGQSQEYLSCLQEAQGQDEIQACAESLQ